MDENIFADVKVAGEPSEEERKANRALILFAFGKGYVITFTASTYIVDYIVDMCGAHNTESFSLDDASIGYESKPDGLYIGDFKWVDEGPGDWPGSREMSLDVVIHRQAREEEWAAHLRGDYPWSPMKCTCGEDDRDMKGEPPLPHKTGCPAADE